MAAVATKPSPASFISSPSSRKARRAAPTLRSARRPRSPRRTAVGPSPRRQPRRRKSAATPSPRSSAAVPSSARPGRPTAPPRLVGSPFLGGVTMGKGKWYGHKASPGKGSWDRQKAKPPRAPKQLPEGPVSEIVSVILKKIGAADDDASNLRTAVQGDMSFGAFTVMARQVLNVGADRPLQLLVGRRTPDADEVMSSFPKEGFLYVSYGLH